MRPTRCRDPRPLPNTSAVPTLLAPDEREEFIKEHADTDAQQLATQFDDTIDTVIDDFSRQNGHLPQSEDASEMISAARKTMVYELLASIEHMKGELSRLTIHTAIRSAASMTGCSPPHDDRIETQPAGFAE